MQNLKYSVPQIQHIPFVEVASQRCRTNGILSKVEILLWQCQKRLGPNETARNRVVQRGVRVDILLQSMAQTTVEFMSTADVVEVAVCGDTFERFFRKAGKFRFERAQTHSGIDQEIAVPPLYMPDVTSQPACDMNFGNQANALAYFSERIPAVRHPRGFLNRGHDR